MPRFAPIRTPNQSQLQLTDDSELHDDGFCADAGCGRCCSDYDLDAGGRAPRGQRPAGSVATLARRPVARYPLPPP